jgi:hypothetical protein
MTRFDDDDLKKVERALSEVHRSRAEPSLDADWALRVMQDIRRVAAGRMRSRELPGVARLVWRTAAVAAALALVFTGSVWFYAPGDPIETSALWASDFDAAIPFIE